LFLLYRAANDHFTMNLKAQAASMGAEIDWDDDWYDPAPPKEIPTLGASDFRFLPIGLGYEAPS
jgi:hypothetical protein